MRHEEIADLHNRRANINLVAQRAREHGYPYLVWPEDQELLRLADLPRLTHVNLPVTWTNVATTIHFLVHTDQQLRHFIKVGYAYVINPALGQFNGVFVQEYKVVTQ